MSKSINSVTYEKTQWQRSKVIRRWLLVFVYISSIFAVSAIPGGTLPKVDISDKLLHVVEFGILAFLLCRALRAQVPTYSRYCIMVISILATIGYGATDEVHQLLVAQRTSDLADLVADGLGACLAAWGWYKAGTHWSWLQ